MGARDLSWRPAADPAAGWPGAGVRVLSTELLLLYALRLLAVVCVASLLIIGAQGLRIVVSRRALAKRLNLGRSVLISLVTADAVRIEDLAPLRDIPADDQDELLIALGRNLDGAAKVRLRDLARKLGAVGRARRLIRSRFWWRRLRGAQILTVVGGEEDAMLPLIGDRHTMVREQAIQWAAEHPSPAVVRALLELLAEPEDLSEFAILHSLIRLGDVVAEPLSGYLLRWWGRPLERALRVAVAHPHAEYATAALHLSRHPDAGVRACAADLLAALGVVHGMDVLERLLSDPDPRARRAAVRALGEMRYKPAAARVARMLRDPEWDVRWAAGVALHEMGDAGRDLLRQAVYDEDPFASGMARQIIDIVSTQAEDRAG